MKKAILISCFDWYSKRLEAIKDTLEEYDYKVEIYTSDFSHISKEYLDKKNNYCSYIHVHKYTKNISFDRLKSHYLFSKCIYKALCKSNPNLIYGLIPPNSISKFCSKYKKKHPDCKLIYDVIDLWPESMPISKYRWFKPLKIWKNMRDNSIKLCDYLVTECNYYLKSLKKYDCKHKTLYLYKKDDISELNFNVKKENKNNIVLGYVGSINNILDIETIINISNQIKERYNLMLKIIGVGESKDILLKQLADNDIKYEYYGPIFDETEKRKILQECDFGLNLMKSTVNVGLTIKSIDYFSYGLPIINNIKGDTFDLVKNENIGINVMLNGISFDDLTRLMNDKLINQKVYSVFKNNFTRDKFIQNFKEILNTL